MEERNKRQRIRKMHPVDKDKVGLQVSKNQRHSRQRSQNEQIKQLVKDTAAVLGLTIKILTPYQIRLSAGGKMLDIYTSAKSYHDIISNQKGPIGSNVKTFIIEFFK